MAHISGAFLAATEDDLLQLLDSPLPNDDTSVTYKYISLTDIINYLPSDIGHTHMAWAWVKDIDLSDKWLIDSRASQIMCSNHHWFHHFSPLPNHIMITLGNNSTIPTTSHGRILVWINAGGHHERIMLQDILYIPDIGGNLLSVSYFVHRGAEIHFKGEGCKLLNQHGEVTCISHLHRNLYIMDMTVITNEHTKITFVNKFPSKGEDPPSTALSMYTSTTTTDLTTWHHHLGHLNADNVTLMQTKSMVTGMDITKGSTLVKPCKPCLKGKQTHTEI